MYIILYIKIVFNIGLNIKVLWYVGGLFLLLCYNVWYWIVYCKYIIVFSILNFVLYFKFCFIYYVVVKYRIINYFLIVIFDMFDINNFKWLYVKIYDF